MAIQHTVTAEGDTLLVRAWGFDEDLADVQRYGEAVIAGCLAAGCTRVLCDESRLEYRLGILDTYRAATFLAEHAPRVARIALVCPASGFSDARFWEDVAVNRGLLVRVFTSTDAAKAWLGLTA
jgi:hypothetical protein